MSRLIRHFYCLLLALVMAVYAAPGAAQPDAVLDQPSPGHAALAHEAWQGFGSRLHLLASGIAQQPVDSRLNPNNLLNLPRYQAALDLRPDLHLNFRRLELSLKPRAEFRWQQWEDGLRQGESDTDTEFFVNAWLARWRLSEQLFVSYGRENLQWGPSYLVSPSNPFNRNNGRNNPRQEVPGLDYGRLVWIPSASWSLSFIANTDAGRLQLHREFENTYALKLDYTGDGKYLSLIPAYREDGPFRLGFFAGWAVNDFFLLHTEGNIAEQLGDSQLLVGADYTLEAGPTITVEFLHQGNGCTREPVARCFVLTPAGPVLASQSFPDALLRKNYLLLQYVHTQIRDRLSLILRWTRNLDDDSNRFISIIDYELGQHLQVFTNGGVEVGAKEAEFGSLLRYAVQVGFAYTF